MNISLLTGAPFTVTNDVRRIVSFLFSIVLTLLLLQLGLSTPAFVKPGKTLKVN